MLASDGGGIDSKPAPGSLEGGSVGTGGGGGGGGGANVGGEGSATAVEADTGGGVVTVLAGCVGICPSNDDGCGCC